VSYWIIKKVHCKSQVGQKYNFFKLNVIKYQKRERAEFIFLKIFLYKKEKILTLNIIWSASFEQGKANFLSDMVFMRMFYRGFDWKIQWFTSSKEEHNNK
jgi:hypothetical protein